MEMLLKKNISGEEGGDGYVREKREEPIREKHRRIRQEKCRLQGNQKKDQSDL